MSTRCTVVLTSQCKVKAIRRENMFERVERDGTLLQHLAGQINDHS
jgi:hypothetical protein